MSKFDIVDNKVKLVGDKLKESIVVNSKIKMVIQSFSIYAFKAFEELLDNIDELQIILDNDNFYIEEIMKSDVKEFLLRNQFNNIYGDKYEIKLKNKLLQKALSLKLSQWIKQKATFKLNITKKEFNNNFLLLDNYHTKLFLHPLKHFNTSELGYSKNNYINSSYYFIEDDENTFFNNLINFNKLWQDENSLVNITNDILFSLSNLYKENSPYFIYILSIYHIFKNHFLDEENHLPDEKSGYKDSLIWKKLYSFQQDGVTAIIAKLEKYQGCILSDSVGLGKTFTALAVMKYYSNRNKNILVLSPKKLANNWKTYWRNDINNIFFEDKINFDLLYHTDISRTKGESNGLNFNTINWSNYDLLVIDESHNFRNYQTTEGYSNRYKFLLEQVIKKGVRTKILMLSATPVNNSFKDLKNQLRLIYEPDIEQFSKALNTNIGVEQILDNANSSFKKWQKNFDNDKKSNIENLINDLDINFSILLDAISIARSRKHIKTFYNESEIGRFPQRLATISIQSPLNRDNKTSISGLSYQYIYEKFSSLILALYSPSLYIQDSRLYKYVKNDTAIEGRVTLTQKNREKNLIKLMMSLLFKRLESSVFSLIKTLKNIENKINEILNQIEKYKKDRKNIVQVIDPKSFLSDEEVDNDFEEEYTVGKLEISFEDMDLESFKYDLSHDRDVVKDIFIKLEQVSDIEDVKLHKLIEIIKDKINNPFNKNNKKILIFTSYADTAHYLYEHIAKYFKDNFSLNSALIEGNINNNKSTLKSKNKDSNFLLTLFSPISKEKDKIWPNENEYIDILIATDCISEGQNLQDCDICISYDIHWNPVRIIQRFGRIDRIGSKNDFIKMINFWPDISLDLYINLQAKVMSKVAIVNIGSTGEDNVLDTNQEWKFRYEQIEKLKSGELFDLEELKTNISITDLGLNEFRNDFLDSQKQNLDLQKYPLGIYAVSESLKSEYQGVIFILKNSSLIDSTLAKNLIFPYYMIYVSNDGQIIYNYSQIRKILSNFKFFTQNKNEPMKFLCKEFNKETNQGENMNHYTFLLDKAIESIIGLKQGNDVLEELQGFNNKNQKYKSSQFELITFLVIK